MTNIDAMAAASLSVFTYDYPTTRIDLSLLSFPSLDDPGRVRLNADAEAETRNLPRLLHLVRVVATTPTTTGRNPHPTRENRTISASRCRSAGRFDPGDARAAVNSANCRIRIVRGRCVSYLQAAVT